MNFEKWMDIALEQARLAMDLDEVPVGAVVVKGNELICMGHNTMNKTGDDSNHAEMIVLREAKKRLGSLEGCTLFVTLEPCAMCAGAMVNFKLPTLVYGAFDERCGCCGSRMDITDHWFNHSIKTFAAIRCDECSRLLSNFFSKKR